MIFRNALSTRHIVAFLLLFLTMQTSFAGPVQEEAARKIAIRFASTFTPLRSAEEDLTLVMSGAVHPATTLRGSRQASLYYIYTLDGGKGFVIVSGEDTTYPILGYATEGTFRTEQMPENLAYWLKSYQEEISYSIQSGQPATAEIEKQWNSFEKGDNIITPAVLLSTANWDQGAPYNNLCPVDAKGKTSVTGCVATAMGIAMKYYNWPEKGTGSNSYRTKTDSIRVFSSFNTSYDWNNMLDNYTTTGGVQNWNATQGEAVATLLYHCGVSVDMNYTSTSSGAYTHDVIAALVNHFSYDKSMSLVARDLYSNEEWKAIIRGELDNNRPVVYGGATEDNSGHLFIIDGYATTDDYFHVNWGWSGYSNGYYRLSSLAPTYQGIGGNKEGAGYSYSQDAVIGMRKAQSNSYINNELHFYIPQEDVNNGVYGLYLKEDKIIQNKPFSLCYTYFADYGWRDFHGEIAVFQEDKNRQVKDTLCIMATDEKGLLAGWSYYDNEGMELTIEGKVEEGDLIRMYYRPKGYDWRPLRGEPGTVTELAVYNETATSTTKAIKEEKIRTEMKEGRLYIYFSPDTKIKQVKTYTLQGQEVAAQPYNTTVSPIVVDLKTSDNEVFIVTVHTTEGMISRKVILRK